MASDAPFIVTGNYAAASDGGGFLVTFSQDGLEGEVAGISYAGGEAMPLACEWKVEEDVRYLTFKMEDSEFYIRPGEKDGKDMLLGRWVDDAGDSGAWNLAPMPSFAKDFKAEDLTGKWFTPGPGEGAPAWIMDVEKDGENWKGSFTLDGETFAIMMSASEKTFALLDGEGQTKLEDKDFEPVSDGIALRFPLGEDDGQLWWRSV
mmetsp:Transcript_68094/g.210674  ORF Transcript_68094/g.210674 Transcript_68094/m.210674 type:complete len:205 (+) Transcript_68094:85-699(+)